jgi:hypothetical protein
MNRLFLQASLLLGVTFSLACGALPSAHCDMRQDGETSLSRLKCQERLNSLASAAFKATCSAIPNAKAGDGSCPSANKVGGCQEGAQGDGSKINDWYYAPATVEQVKAECGSSPFLSP